MDKTITQARDFLTQHSVSRPESDENASKYPKQWPSSSVTLLQVSSTSNESTTYRFLTLSFPNQLEAADFRPNGVAWFCDTQTNGLVSQKSMRKSCCSAIQLLTFLGDNHGSDVTPLSETRSHVEVSVSSYGICTYKDENHASKSRGKESSGGAVLFRKYVFSFLRGRTSFRSEQLLHCRSGQLKSDYLLSFHAWKEGAAFKRISIASGLCLFGAALISQVHELDDTEMSSAGGQHSLLDTILKQDVLYENEAILRLSNTIADFACLIVQSLEQKKAADSQHSSLLPIDIKLDVARLQYYEIAYEMLQSKKWSCVSAKRWLEVVDQRHDSLFRNFRTAIENCLQTRGIIDHDNDIIRIREGQGAMAAERAFRDIVTENKQTSPSSIVTACYQALRDSKLGPWEKILELAEIASADNELTMRDLSLLTYQYEYLAPLLEERNDQDENEITENLKPRCVLVIDDPAEWKIFENASRLLRRYLKAHQHRSSSSQQQQQQQQCLLLGVFPHSRIVSGKTGSGPQIVNEDLFYHNSRREYHYHHREAGLSDGGFPAGFPSSDDDNDNNDDKGTLDITSLVNHAHELACPHDST